MHRSLAVLATALVLLLAVSVPASAATWFQIRYWHTNVTANNEGLQVTWNSPVLGFTIRRDFGGGMWAGSFSLDTGSMNNIVGPPTTGGEYNRFWSLNLHRNLPLQNGMASVYFGWGSLAVEVPNAPAYLRKSAPRIGADVKIPFRGNWYVTGDFSYAFGGSNDQFNFFTGGNATFSSTAIDYRAALGYTMGNWAVEGGYRVIDWTITPGPSTCAGTPCNIRWPGWYVGLNFTSP